MLALLCIIAASWAAALGDLSRSVQCAQDNTVGVARSVPTLSHYAVLV